MVLAPNIASNILPVIVLGAVLLLIAFRQIGNIRLAIWQIMLGGALAVLLSGQITALDALKSINLDVILFLFGMFVVGVALEESGYLAHVSYRLFKRAKTANALMLVVLFGMGFASAFLMNDTIAIIGTPIILLLARKHATSAKPLLLALCFAVTIGSVMSPIGNPQNLLIAINGNIPNPFLTFLEYLFVPTAVNLIITFFVLKFFYREYFHRKRLNHSQEPIKNHRLALISKISLVLIALLVIVKILFSFFNTAFDLRITYIALAAALPIVVFSKERFTILKKVDWHTLIFFAAMFVLMASVWESGFFQSIIQGMQLNIASLAMILTISIILSQFISNVPLAALYTPLLLQAGAQTKELLALAAGSTIAGNLFIFGAASNVIVIQNAEKKAKETLTFWEFARTGIPLTIINVLVYWLFFVIFG
ncbi:anion transporter [Candidatus Woesearchaeota archaeon]|nr:anion transporter [Candidatus Woesearchaeota archaeon]